MVRVLVTGKVTSNVNGTGVTDPSVAEAVGSKVSSGVDSVFVGLGATEVVEGCAVADDISLESGARVRVAVCSIVSVIVSTGGDFEGSINRKTAKITVVKTPKVKTYPAFESGRKRKMASVINPKIVAEAK